MDTLVQLTDVSKRYGSDGSLIVVTHNPDPAARYARRVIEIVDGQVAGDAHLTGASR